MKTLTFILAMLVIFGCTKKNDINLFVEDDRSAYMNTLRTNDGELIFIATSRSNETEERRVEHFEKHLDVIKAIKPTVAKFNVEITYNTCREIIDQFLRVPEIEGVNMFFTNRSGKLDKTKYTKDDCIPIGGPDATEDLLQDAAFMDEVLRTW